MRKVSLAPHVTFRTLKDANPRIFGEALMHQWQRGQYVSLEKTGPAEKVAEARCLPVDIARLFSGNGSYKQTHSARFSLRLAEMRIVPVRRGPCPKGR
jgi:hypothetical protein